MLATAGFARAIVLKSSLSAHPIKPGVTISITLYFNSRIEAKLSRAVLVSRDHVERSLGLVAGKSAGEALVALRPLEPGNYAARCKRWNGPQKSQGSNAVICDLQATTDVAPRLRRASARDAQRQKIAGSCGRMELREEIPSGAGAVTSP